jgi:chromosome segregation ATPase
MDTLASIGLVEIKKDAPPGDVHDRVTAPPSAPPATGPAIGYAAGGSAHGAGAAPDPALVAELDQSAHEQLMLSITNSGAKLVTELASLLDTLKENITDEAALYKMALKLLFKGGHNVTDLAGDYDKCIGAIEQTDRDFEAELGKEFAKRVGGKQHAIEEATAAIATLQAEIAERQQSIAELAARSEQTRTGIAESQAKLDLTKQRFTAVYSEIRAGLQAARDKITKYGEKL